MKNFNRNNAIKSLETIANRLDSLYGQWLDCDTIDKVEGAQENYAIGAAAQLTHNAAQILDQARLLLECAEI